MDAVLNKRIGRRAVFAGLGAAAAAAAGGAYLMGRAPAGFGSLDDYGFVRSEGSAVLTLVDMASGAVAGEVEFPAAADSVVVARAAGRILALDRTGRRLFFYDLAALGVTATLALPFAPEEMVLSPDGLTLAVAGRAAGRLALVDTVEAGLKAGIEGIDNAGNLSFSSDSGYVFVPDTPGARLRILDVLSGLELDPIPLSFSGLSVPKDPGDGLSAVTRTPNGLYGAVVDARSGRLSVIHFRNWAEWMQIDIGADATRPYITADGRFMMVASGAERAVTVIETLGFTTAGRFPAPRGVTSIATGYFETVAAVISGVERRAVFLDLEAMQPAGEIAFEGTPGSAVVDANGLALFVPLRETRQLAIISMERRRIERMVSGAGSAPASVRLASTNNYCH